MGESLSSWPESHSETVTTRFVAVDRHVSHTEVLDPTRCKSFHLISVWTCGLGLESETPTVRLLLGELDRRDHAEVLEHHVHRVGVVDGLGLRGLPPLPAAAGGLLCEL